ncbi:MAG: hypothetical protein ACHQ6U_13315 [Thermodesulfobacteriota bacterium]
MSTEVNIPQKYVPKGCDVEIDRREYNGLTVVLLEDRRRNTMLPDGTSKQYILCVETRAVESSNIDSFHYRHITKLMWKKTGQSAKDIARDRRSQFTSLDFTQ